MNTLKKQTIGAISKKRQLYRGEQLNREQQLQLKEQRRKIEEKDTRGSAPPGRPFD